MSYTVRGSVLTAADAAASDWFGGAVALNSTGTILAVGASQWEGAASAMGGVYIYDWSGSAWVQRGGVLTASDALSADNFGSAVAFDATGTVLAVGASGRSNGNRRGAVYLYDWTGSAWVERAAILTPADAANDDFFGAAVALSADASVLIVGAPFWEGASSGQGGVYVFDWSGSAYVQRGSVLTASDFGGNDSFGRCVTVNADASILAVGANQWDGSHTDKGAVYLYDWSGSAWVERGALIQPDVSTAYANFGYSVALDNAGDLIAIGHYLYDGSATNEGAVEVYAWSGSAWSITQTIVAADAAANDYFGSAVAFSDDSGLLVIGAVGWEGGATDQGGVYSFTAPLPAPECLILAGSPLGAPAIYAISGYPLTGYIAAAGPLESVAMIAAVARRVPHLYRFSAYISGAQDGVADYPFALKSVGISKRSGAASYYSISTVFSAELIDAFTARPNGMVHLLRDGNPWESFNVGHPIRPDIGPRSASISISGTRQVTLASSSDLAIQPSHVVEDGVDSAGLLTLKLVPGTFDPRPNDTFTWAGADYVVALNKFQANESGQTLTINAAAA